MPLKAGRVRGAGDLVEDLAHHLSPAMHVLCRNGPLAAQDQARFLAANGDDAVIARYRSYGDLTMTGWPSIAIGRSGAGRANTGRR